MEHDITTKGVSAFTYEEIETTFRECEDLSIEFRQKILTNVDDLFHSMFDAVHKMDWM
jgi:hypothetical protein